MKMCWCRGRRRSSAMSSETCCSSLWRTLRWVSHLFSARSWGRTSHICTRKTRTISFIKTCLAVGIVAGIILVHSRILTMEVMGCVAFKVVIVRILLMEGWKMPKPHAHRGHIIYYYLSSIIFTLPHVCFLCCIHLAFADFSFGPGVASVVNTGWGCSQRLSLCLHPSMLLRERGQGPSV